MLLKIHPDNPSERKIAQVIDILDKGGVVIYPTDTVYGLGCDIFNRKAIEKVCRIRGLDPKKAQLSFICEDISQIAEYSKPIDNELFRLMKQILPGPYTLILNANNQVPKLLKSRRSTFGVRLPDHQIITDIVKGLGRPVLTTSLKSEDEILEYFSDPVDIHDDFEKLVDVVIDGGPGSNIPSTVIDCTGNEPVVIREGAGSVDW